MASCSNPGHIDFESSKNLNIENLNREMLKRVLGYKDKKPRHFDEIEENDTEAL